MGPFLYSILFFKLLTLSIYSLQDFFKKTEYFLLFGTISFFNLDFLIKYLIRQAKSQSQVIITALLYSEIYIIVSSTSSASTFHLIFQFFNSNTSLKTIINQDSYKKLYNSWFQDIYHINKYALDTLYLSFKYTLNLFRSIFHHCSFNDHIKILRIYKSIIIFFFFHLYFKIKN